jgi:hypothetical protein
VNDKIRLGCGDAGGQPGERPACRDIAILKSAAIVVGIRPGGLTCCLETTAGVAEGGDRVQRRLEHRQFHAPAAGDARGFYTRREREFADQDRERGVGQGANVHRLLVAVDADLRTSRRFGNDGPRQRALRTEHHIRGLELLGARCGRNQPAREDERTG